MKHHLEKLINIYEMTAVGIGKEKKVSKEKIRLNKVAILFVSQITFQKTYLVIF